MLNFHSLRVADVRRETIDSVSIALAVPEAHIGAFRFQAGQFVTLRTQLNGEEIRRAYSIHIAPVEFEKTQQLRVGIKRVQGGKFSTWVNASLNVGDAIEVLPPDGRFVVPIDPSRAKRYVAFAGGSGITPILSLMETILRSEPDAQVTLVYGNRTVSSIMFSESIEDQKNRFLDRFRVIHVLSDEIQESALLSGLLNQEKCADLLKTLIPVGEIDCALICGPEPMMDAAEAALLDAGLAKEKILIERFGVPMPASAPNAAAQQGVSATQLTILADGKQRRVPLREGQAVLDAGLASGIPLPYACKAGVCCTCKAKVLHGTVTMTRNFTLTEAEQAQGFVLTCQAQCQSPEVTISYDER
jgi:ring-1,2-phenylacetyl-CoA epoxidase subunit PaaE